MKDLVFKHDASKAKHSNSTWGRAAVQKALQKSCIAAGVWPVGRFVNCSVSKIVNLSSSAQLGVQAWCDLSITAKGLWDGQVLLHHSKS